MAIPEQVVSAAQRLLRDTDKSHRQIGHELGISRGTVGAIARGKRRPPKRQGPAEPFDPSAPYQRCPGCGGLVRMPCFACRVESIQRRVAAMWAPSRDHTTAVEIREADARERLEALRIQKMLRGERTALGPSAAIDDDEATPTKEDLVAIEREGTAKR